MTAPLQPPPNLPASQERKTQSRRRNGVDTRGMLSIVTMLVSLAALTAAMIGAARMIIDVSMTACPMPSMESLSRSSY